MAKAIDYGLVAALIGVMVIGAILTFFTDDNTATVTMSALRKQARIVHEERNHFMGKALKLCLMEQAPKPDICAEHYAEQMIDDPKVH